MTTDRFDLTPAADAPAELSYDDVVTLTAWMAAAGCTATEVAYAVEKPWKHHDELDLARAAAPPRPKLLARPVPASARRSQGRSAARGEVGQ